MNPRRFFVGRAIGLLVVLGLVGAFYLFNTYIYHAEQGPSPRIFADGEYVGFVHALVDNNTAMDFDDAVWLTGDAAYAAAQAAGVCEGQSRADCLPNDYFIQNTVAKDERIAIAPSVAISMQTWHMADTGKVTKEAISLEQFAGLVNDSTLHWRNLPYTVTVSKGVVTRIEEIYVP